MNANLSFYGRGIQALVAFNFLKKSMSINTGGQEGENLTSNSAIQVTNLVSDSLSSPHKFSSEFSTQVAKFCFSLHNANKLTFLQYLAKKTLGIRLHKTMEYLPTNISKEGRVRPSPSG